MGTKLTQYICLLFILSACSLFRSVPKPPNPIGSLKPNPKCAEKGEMCTALEDQFGAYMRSCGISVPDLEKGNASAIPEDVYSERLNLKSNVSMLPRSSAERAFRFIYETNDLAEEDNASTRKYLDIGLSTESLPRSNGASRYLFEYSCSSYVGFAAKLAVEVPVASFKAAISADSAQNSNIMLVVGRFDSPLAFLRKSGSDAIKRYIDLSFWSAYLQGVDPAKAKYLDHFQGAAVFRIKQEKARLHWK